MKPVPFRYWLFASVWSSVVLFRKANHFSGFCYCGWHVNVRLVCILWRMWKSVYGCMSLCRTWSVNFPWVWLDSKVNQFWLSHSVVKSFFGQNTGLTIFFYHRMFSIVSDMDGILRNFSRIENRRSSVQDSVSSHNTIMVVVWLEFFCGTVWSTSSTVLFWNRTELFKVEFCYLQTITARVTGKRCVADWMPCTDCGYYSYLMSVQ